MVNKWSKEEEEILRENFSSMKWQYLLETLSDKTEKQIITKARKLGVKRKSEIVDVYYDEEQKAWVEKSINFLGTIHKVNSIFPAPKGTTFEEVKDKLSEKVSKIFAETIVVPKYIELINKVGIAHNDDLYSIFFKMEKELFKTSDKVERDKIVNRYWIQLEPVIKSILDNEGSK
jgi:hypothetical protein